MKIVVSYRQYKFTYVHTSNYNLDKYKSALVSMAVDLSNGYQYLLEFIELEYDWEVIPITETKLDKLPFVSK